MALSDQTKIEVLRFLGWPATTIDTASTNYNSGIAQKLTLSNTTIENVVKNYVERLQALDLRLDGAAERVVALQVDDIKLNPEEIDRLKGEKARLARELSRFLEIPVKGGSGIMFGVCV